MNLKLLSLKNLLIILLLLIGIILSVYLVQQTQIFKSKATTNAAHAINIIQENNQGRTELSPTEESGVPVFNVEGNSTIKIKLKDDPNVLDMFKD